MRFSASTGSVKSPVVPGGLSSGSSGVGFGDVEAELSELGDECAQAAVVVEPGLVVGEYAGGGLAVFLAGPLVVGAVQLGRVGVAAVVRVAAAGSSGRPGCRAGRS